MRFLGAAVPVTAAAAMPYNGAGWPRRRRRTAGGVAALPVPRPGRRHLGKTASHFTEGLMPHFSIRARLVFLSSLLLLILVISSTLLIRELARDLSILSEQARLVSIVRSANLASRDFGDLKYWITDYAVTRLTRSQENADAAKAKLRASLKDIASVEPALVAAIVREVDTLSDLSHKAAEAYSSDDSAAGNELIAQAQTRILNVNDQIESIVAGLEQQALRQRDTAMREVDRAVTASVIGGIVVLIGAVVLTAWIVRSINSPLRQLEHSMAAITHGELDVPIPRSGRDEIGAMAEALHMLRDNLIERERMDEERRRAEAAIRSARDAAEAALKDLKTAQASLIHAEKMASLGQLTAGIAHEIKNPLNFVNNFATLSVELLDELKTTAAPALDTLDDVARAEISETVDMLTSNLDKIAQHGRRADGIVKSMLAHSRGSSGERQRVDLNALVEEALNLAYHGARAQDQSFNIALERQFTPAIPPIELVPQDVTRVFLNLISNGFHAAHKRLDEADDPGFRPTLSVATRDLGDAVEVRVRDNGIGIPPEIKDKLFQPFFTTKPTGEGTGLGLSISWDIVTQQHGGTITVDSEPGSFTEFTVRLPRHSPAAAAGVRQSRDDAQPD
jgi:signal transduction histidine kinase